MKRVAEEIITYAIPLLAEAVVVAFIIGVAVVWVAISTGA